MVKRASYEAPHYAVFSSLLPLPPSKVQIFSSAPCSQIPSIYVLLLVWRIKFHIHTKPVVNVWFSYYSLWVFGEETWRKKVLNRLIAKIPRILFALNIFVNAILSFWCCFLNIS